MNHISYSRAQSVYKQVEDKGKFERRWGKYKGLHVPVLTVLDNRVKDMLSVYHKGKPKAIHPSKVIGLTSLGRSECYSRSFHPIGEQPFPSNWVAKALETRVYDSGEIGLVPVGDYYFVLNQPYEENNTNQSNGHYYVSVSKAFNRGFVATVYPALDDGVQKDIIENNQDIFDDKKKGKGLTGLVQSILFE